jgi:hypothetical protein
VNETLVCELSVGGTNPRECVKAMDKNCLHHDVRHTPPFETLVCELSVGGTNQRECVKAMDKNCLHPP